MVIPYIFPEIFKKFDTSLTFYEFPNFFTLS